ncbi:MAG: nucleotidyltransferase domain-containing protein [Methylococcaceae bacterium]|nr:MAG: nucleotidyltransferase domain-containing protein [Methylococcaceae bacterium]
MRLTTEQIQAIREETRMVFGADSSVRLFGSRVDDTARGGDIDLLVECDEPVKERLKKSLALTARLQMRLGDQPIDVLVIDPETPLQPVHQVARQMGILL